MKRGVSFADQGVRLFIDHVCWFSDAYTFICRGGTLAAGQTGNVVFYRLV